MYLKSNEPTKNEEAMKKTMRFLSMAALALVGAMMTGCSSDDNTTAELQPASNVVTLTTTVSLDDGAATRALDIDFTNQKATKTFAEGDQIAVIYKDQVGYTRKAVSTALTAGDITNEGKSATFTVTLAPDPAANSKVRYIYPAAMARTSLDSDAGVDRDDQTIDFTHLAMQDGTLASLGSSIDLSTFDGNLTSEAKLPATASMTNRLAILALTLKDDKGTVETSDDVDITNTITGLTFFDGFHDTYAVSRSAAAGPIYIAIKATSNDAPKVSATDGSKLYTKSLGDKTYSANNFYNISWRMTEGATETIDLASVTSDTEIPNGALVTGTLANEKKISIAAGAIVKLDGVSINADGTMTGHNAGITCLGDATIILKDGTTNTVKGFYQDYPGIFVNEGKTLTISGTGTLNASSNGWGTGIGGGQNIYQNSGNIVITGGTVNATGGQYCPGIGSGRGATGGDITITGGAVTAQGGLYAAGIGAGYGDGSMMSTCGNITITGGTVNATGGEWGAGIGAGNQMSECGNIYISGGTVTANGGTGSGEGGAGIGSGHAGDCDINQCGDIYITGGTITATGGYHSAGIGTGSGGSHTTTCGDITITNTVTKVTATKGDYAPNSIGKGYGSNVVCGTITIGGADQGTGVTTSPYTYQP